MSDRKVRVWKVEPIFTDDRGTISDILETTINHVGIVASKKGSVRGKHYHKKSDQYMYMVKGKILMKTKDISIPSSKVETKIIEEGDAVFIPSMTIHSFEAIEESVFLDLTTESRKGTGYEDDTVRVEI